MMVSAVCLATSKHVVASGTETGTSEKRRRLEPNAPRAPRPQMVKQLRPFYIAEYSESPDSFKEIWHQKEETRAEQVASGLGCEHLKRHRPDTFAVTVSAKLDTEIFRQTRFRGPDECLSDIITEFEEQVEESLEEAIDAAVRAPFSRQIFKVWCVGKEGILKAPIPSDDLVYRESLKTTLGENSYSGGLWIHLEPPAFQGWC